MHRREIIYLLKTHSGGKKMLMNFVFKAKIILYCCRVAKFSSQSQVLNNTALFASGYSQVPLESISFTFGWLTVYSCMKFLDFNCAKRDKIKKKKSDNFNGTSVRPLPPVQNHIWIFTSCYYVSHWGKEMCVYFLCLRAVR